MQKFILLNKETSQSNFLIIVLSETINESGNALAFSSINHSQRMDFVLCMKELKSNNYVNPSFMLSVISHKGAQEQASFNSILS